MSEDTHLPAGGPLHERGTVTSETLQPFDKMQPGEVDKVFRAACPKCDHREWIFFGKPGAEFGTVDPDVRVCRHCRYAHWLRGPNESEVIPLRTGSPAGASKKDRVRALVHSLLLGGWNARSNTIYTVVMQAQDIDSEIEDTK
jgi:hypothetical protein